MSQLATGIFGAIAISMTFGVAQFALGRDLSFNPLGGNEAAINRAAKADRAAVVTGSPMPMRTISLRLDSLSDTSILIRMPVAREVAQQARNRPPAPSVLKPGTGKPTLACEPVVSVLTEVAKLLQPGRCVT
jgi:hypothetical protein